MAFLDSLDLDVTFDQDYIIGQDGDLKDTSEDYLLSLENEIRTIVKSDTLDWIKHPMLGCNLLDFQGEANTRRIGGLIEDRVRSRILDIGIVPDSALGIRVSPVGEHEVIIIITIQATATPNNRLTPGDPLTITLTYDTIENSIFFIPRNPIKQQFR